MALKYTIINNTNNGLEILSDPEIPQIDWNCLEVAENLGSGASGIVSKGFWHHDDGSSMFVVPTHLASS